jgi:hypothetical protein
MKYVLSVDPGKATGVCVLVWDEEKDEVPSIQYSGEVQPEEFAEVIEVALFNLSHLDTFSVVCERFVINAQTVRNSQAPYSLEQIGVLKHLCRKNNFSVEKIAFQNPVDAKTMFPNDKLKKIGTWHKGGEGHANDAIRHALLRFTRLGWVPRVLLD